MQQLAMHAGVPGNDLLFGRVGCRFRFSGEAVFKVKSETFLRTFRKMSLKSYSQRRCVRLQSLSVVELKHFDNLTLDETASVLSCRNPDGVKGGATTPCQQGRAKDEGGEIPKRSIGEKKKETRKLHSAPEAEQGIPALYKTH